MARVAMIGAGSVVFANNILGDLLTFPELKDDLEFSLHDIDPQRLAVSEGFARRRIEAEGAKAVVRVTDDLQKALAGADYVINMVQVGGFSATLTDFTIPAKYGLRQTIADTHGIGGIFRALRTIPVVVDICRQMEQYCPEALLINYSNPMAMNVWAAYRASAIETVGLCHSIQLTSAMLANYMDIPIGELSYRAAGINHICWFLELSHKGRDLYPLLFEKMEDPLVYSSDRVRFEIMKHFGYFVSESSEHMAEYVPYFITRDDLIEKLQIPIDEYLRRCEEQDLEFAKNEEIATGRRDLPLHYRTLEYAAPIIHAIEVNQPALIYGNVENRGVVNNLPHGCCVEVPCLVDANGIAPVYSGELPPQLAAINRNHISVQELTVKAILEKKKEYIYYACRLDPLAAAVLSLEQIDNLVEEMITAHKPYIFNDSKGT
jgi:alpha-galactosidase